MFIEKLESPNFDERRGGGTPRYLILHYTGTQDAESAKAAYMDKEPKSSVGRISPHYMIDERGQVTQFVDESKRAWHAGAAYWEADRDINSSSIGIELVNAGHEDKDSLPEFPARQMTTLVQLGQDIVRRHGIHSYNVLGHSDIAPGRKKDPGEAFPWRELARKGLGLWPEPNEEDYEQAPTLVYNVRRLKGAFEELGYNPVVVVRELIVAFQRHYFPEVFAEPEFVGSADPEMAARMLALLRAKQVQTKD